MAANKLTERAVVLCPIVTSRDHVTVCVGWCTSRAISDSLLFCKTRDIACLWKSERCLSKRMMISIMPAATIDAVDNGYYLQLGQHCASNSLWLTPQEVLDGSCLKLSVTAASFTGTDHGRHFARKSTARCACDAGREVRRRMAIAAAAHCSFLRMTPANS